MMRASKHMMMLGVALALITSLVPPALRAQNVFGRSLANLSDADRQAMERARNDVLAKMQAGAVAMWMDERTGHSGEARIARTYQQNGLMCAEVDHLLKLPRESRFVIPFCRDSTGTWRAVF
jgi:surface antigen